MANCNICGDKISMMGGNFISDNVRVCNKCYSNIVNLLVQENPDGEAILKSRKYFEHYIAQGTLDDSTLAVLTDKLNASMKSERQADIMREKKMESEKRAQAFKLTTGYNFEGFRIISYKNLVGGDIVLGTGILNELYAGVNDFLGTNSDEFEAKVEEAKKMAIKNMTRHALDLGANAIIGVAFNIATISKTNLVMVSVNGTAVNIEKKE